MVQSSIEVKEGTTEKVDCRSWLSNRFWGWEETSYTYFSLYSRSLHGCCRCLLECIKIVKPEESSIPAISCLPCVMCTMYPIGSCFGCLSKLGSSRYGSHAGGESFTSRVGVMHSRRSSECLPMTLDVDWVAYHRPQVQGHLE